MASHGGARVGAGRKPAKPIFKLANRPTSDAVEDSGVSAIPPSDLPTDQRDFWHRYAALAIEKRTLTVHTVGAFLLLCEMDAEKRATKATIEKDGRTYVKVTVDGTGTEHEELKAHPLTSAYGRLAKAVEALMARFGLAPFGKAEPILAKAKAVNPWSQVAQK
jgi:phage terminase small subunit